MQIERIKITADPSIPAVIIKPDNPCGCVVLMHGYGGCKEEQLGLAWRIAEVDLAVCTNDLRGHGENPLSMDIEMLTDVEAVVSQCREFGKVTAIGHSLGGRLALISSSDFAIGISPSLDREYGEQTRAILKNMRSYRVKAESFETLFDIQAELPVWQPEANRPNLVIYGERDALEIQSACAAVRTSPQTDVKKIPQALHSDIFLLEESIRCIKNQLSDWYKLSD